MLSNVFSHLKLSSIIVFTLGSVVAAAESSPDLPLCNAPGVLARDQWNISVDIDNQSSKDSLKSIIVLLNSGFVGMGAVTANDGSLYMSVAFVRERFGNSESAELALRSGLTTFVSMPGVRIECQPVYRPFPGITIRN